MPSPLERSQSLLPLVRRWVKDFRAWPIDARLKALELVIAVLILGGTVYVGFKANSILAKQNTIVEKQLESSDVLGRKQNQIAVLQAYVTSVHSAGYDTDVGRRMFHASFELYNMLVQENPAYRRLLASMPALTPEQFERLIASSPLEADDITHAYTRLYEAPRSSPANAPYRLVPDGPFHIIVGTFRERANAQGALSAAAQHLRGSGFQPSMNIMQNENEFLLATLSGFATREEAQNAIHRFGIQRRFPSAYAQQQVGWRRICPARGEVCGP